MGIKSGQCCFTVAHVFPVNANTYLFLEYCTLRRKMKIVDFFNYIYIKIYIKIFTSTLNWNKINLIII